LGIIYTFYYNKRIESFATSIPRKIWTFWDNENIPDNLYKESFESNNIDMFVISLRNNDRLENIKSQQDKIDESIQLFDAVKGDTLNISELFKNGIIDEIYENASGKKLREI
jgi:hypothetical protein